MAITNSITLWSSSFVGRCTSITMICSTNRHYTTANCVMPLTAASLNLSSNEPSTSVPHFQYCSLDIQTLVPATGLDTASNLIVLTAQHCIAVSHEIQGYTPLFLNLGFPTTSITGQHHGTLPFTPCSLHAKVATLTLLRRGQWLHFTNRRDSP